MTQSDSHSTALETYRTGDYHATLHSPDQDAPFKTSEFLKLIARIRTARELSICSYVDVGCGGGESARLISAGLRKQGFPLSVTKGYDVSPHVLSLRKDGVDFVHGDFCDSQEQVDLVTLFDVVEHVPDPVTFIRNVAARCRYLGLHIPLDDTLANSFLDRYRNRLEYPGHLVYLDAASALNLVAFSGLLVMDYSYTLGFRAPSGRETLLQRVAFPFRSLFSAVSPWLLSKTIGGASLMVMADTLRGGR